MKPSIEAPIWSNEVSVSFIFHLEDRLDGRTSCCRHDNETRPMVLDKLSHCEDDSREALSQSQSLLSQATASDSRVLIALLELRQIVEGPEGEMVTGQGDWR